LRLHP